MMRKFLVLVATVAVSLAVTVAPVWATCSDGCIEVNLLDFDDNPNDGCYCPKNPSQGSAIGELLMVVVNIISGLVMVLAAVGMIVAGVQYLTARDNEGQVTKAKNRILQIVIGMVAFALMWAFLNWIVPGGVFR